MQELDGTSIAIIGGGVGGLANACYLADAGADVTVYERNEQLGGRVSRLYRDGFTFDMGPSWYLMPDVFDRFFEDFGYETSDFYDLTHLDPHYSVFFMDGDHIEISKDVDATKALFEEYETGAGDALERYLEESQHTYEVGMENFVYEDRSRLRDWIDPSLLWNARGMSVRGTMQEHVEQYFDHPKLQQLMQYTLVFLGGSPTNTPALYNLMSHVDFNLGVWYPEGGLGTVVDALVELGGELGVNYRVNCEVTDIQGRQGAFSINLERPNRSHQSPIADAPENPPAGIALPADGPPHTGNGSTDAAQTQADLIVTNTDLAHLERDLLPPEKRSYGEDYWDSRTYAPSAYMLYLGVEGELPELDHHTLVLPLDWSEHFESIFETPRWPENPSYYLCIPSATDDSVAPDGHSVVVTLVPVAPGLEDDPESRNQFREKMLAELADHLDVDLRDRIVVEESFSVSGFAGRYNSDRGTALGVAHTLFQTALFRPSQRYPGVDGLYTVGAATNPGIGVPMCLISGEITADKILADYT